MPQLMANAFEKLGFERARVPFLQAREVRAFGVHQGSGLGDSTRHSRVYKCFGERFQGSTYKVFWSWALVPRAQDVGLRGFAVAGALWPGGSRYSKVSET